MHAFHSNWTGPFWIKHPRGIYAVEDFELLTTIISALKWQEKNGDIEMITDRRGAIYYKKLGLYDLWNGGISEALEKMDPHIDPQVFWAAGKLLALSQQQGPCVMLDTDFIVWEEMHHILNAHDVSVIHKENLDPVVYPDRDFFQMDKTYHRMSEWNWQVLPCNTALAVFNDVNFKNYYVSEAFRFMKAAKGKDPLKYMVFAEQRLLSMCSAKMKTDLRAISDTNALFHSGQVYFTHVWGYKKYLKRDVQARAAFCKRCIRRIKVDYPHFYPRLLEIDAIKKYIV